MDARLELLARAAREFLALMEETYREDMGDEWIGCEEADALRAALDRMVGL